MPCREVDDFSQKIASDFAAACRTDEESEDCFGTAYNYGRDHVTRLTHEIIQLQRETGLSRKEIVDSIKDLASHMKKQSLKEHLMPNDLIDSTLFLASKASRMVTGQALVVDGGVVVTG